MQKNTSAFRINLNMATFTTFKKIILNEANNLSDFHTDGCHSL